MLVGAERSKSAKWRRIIGPAVALALTALLCSAPALAQVPAPGAASQTATTGDAGALFGLRPGLYGKTTLEKGHYQFAVNPGVEIADSVEIFSFVDRPLQLRLYGADMLQAENGGLAPGQKDDADEVGEWIDLERSDVTVPARGRVKVGFTTRVPEHLKPADYLGAVVAATIPQEGGDNALRIESRVALLVRVRIPGKAILASELGRLKVRGDGRARIFSLEVQNIGNLLQTIKGRVDVMSGNVRVGQVKLDPRGVYIIPRGKATFIGRWESTPMFGGRTATAVILASEPAGDEREFTGNPLEPSFFSWLIVAIAVVVILFALLVLWRRRARGRADATGEGWTQDDTNYAPAHTSFDQH